MLPFSFVRILGTATAVLSIDKRGRRRMLLYAIPVIITFMALAAIGSVLMYTFIQGERINIAGLFITYVTFLFIFSAYSASLQNIPWTINTEIYPTHVIGAASGIAASVGAFSSFLVTFLVLMPA